MYTPEFVNITIDFLIHHVKMNGGEKIGALISITFEGNHGNVSNQSH